MLLPVALVLAWRYRRRGQAGAALLLPIAVGGAWLLAHADKLLVVRPRPHLYPALISMPADFSFPSAHAMQITAFALAWVLAAGTRPGFSGLRYAVVHDFSVACKLVLSALVLAAAFALRAWVDLLLILVVTALVLVAEILNSAIEALCDFVEARHNERIKVIKDIAAAAVGVSIFVWLVVLTIETSRFWQAMSFS